MKRMVVLSDLHLGDPGSVFHCTTKDSQGNEVWVGPDLMRLKNSLSELGVNEENRADYMVLAGDVLDFSIESFGKAYSVARRFFTALRQLKVAREIIYIPGNHDKDVWDSVQKEVNVFMRLKRKKAADPCDFTHEQPGIIDLSPGKDGLLKLPGVNYAEGRKKIKAYGKLFLEGLFRKDEGVKPLFVSVVYPNLYVVLPDGRWIMVTHGHFFQLAWVFITEVFGELLVRREHGREGQKDSQKRTLKWLEQCNIPTNALICTGLGQGGPSSRLIRDIQQEAREEDPKKRKMTEFRNVLETFLKWADKRLVLSIPAEWGQDAAFWFAKKAIWKEVKEVKSHRSKTFLQDNKGLVKKFLDATHSRMTAMNEDYKEKEDVIPDNLQKYPDWVIFGHTHEATSVRKPEILYLTDSSGPARQISFVNTGSCLRGKTAEMTLIDERGNLSSVTVKF